MTDSRTTAGATDDAPDPPPIRTFITEVVANRPVHRGLRLVTFGGGDLVEFTPAGPDTFLYLLLPPPGGRSLTIGRDFTWEQAITMADDVRPVGAYYTVRRWRPEVSELDVLVVLHEPAGHASTWATTAGPGDPVALWGPRTAWDPPAGVARYLLVADETGLPAVAAILEALPREAEVKVVAEVADHAHRQDLPHHPGAEVTWLHRDGAPPGTTTLIPATVRALEPMGPGTYAWGGAESRAVTAVRRHVRREWGLAAEAVSMVGYWRHPESPVDDGRA